MADLRLERDLNISAADLWDYVTTPEGLLQWWGPEGLTVPEHNLDFTRLGPWFSIMMNAEGGRYKASGQVTKIIPNQSVSLTWAWHDDADARGDETQVTFQVEALGNNQARLILEHKGLPDEEGPQTHRAGWTSSLHKLERIIKEANVKGG
jgi:uncharacterized protein YndB with AHSA1/START domain